MALTITKVRDPVLSSAQAGVYDVVFDTNYVSGGYPVTPGQFGRRDIHWLECRQLGVGSRLVEYDHGVPAAGQYRLKIFTALGTEAGAGSDQSGVTVRCFVIGPQA